MTGTPVASQINSVVRRLASTLDLPESAIAAEVLAAFERWDEARVRDFVPILVEREVRALRRVGSAASPVG